MTDGFDDIDNERLERAIATTEGLFDVVSEASLPEQLGSQESAADRSGLSLGQTDAWIWNQTDIFDGEQTTITSSTAQDEYIWNREAEPEPAEAEITDDPETDTAFEWVDKASLTTASTSAEATPDGGSAATPTASRTDSTDRLEEPDDTTDGPGRGEADEENNSGDPTGPSPAVTDTDATPEAGSDTATSEPASTSDRDPETAPSNTAGRFQRGNDIEPASNGESRTDTTAPSDEDARIWKSWEPTTDSSPEALPEGSSAAIDSTPPGGTDESSTTSAETSPESTDTSPSVPESDPQSADENGPSATAQSPPSADLTTSAAALDALLQPRGAQILLKGSMDDAATQTACDRLLDPDYSHHTFIIAPEGHAEERVQQVHTSEDGETTVVALMTQSPTATAQSRTIRTDDADPVTIERVNAYTDFSRVGILISQALSDFDDSLPTVACFHGIETLVQSVDAEPLFKFLHIITNELSMGDVTAHYHIDPDQHPQTTGTIEPLFEQTVTVSPDGYDIETR